MSRAVDQRQLPRRSARGALVVGVSPAYLLQVMSRRGILRQACDFLCCKLVAVEWIATWLQRGSDGGDTKRRAPWLVAKQSGTQSVVITDQMG